MENELLITRPQLASKLLAAGYPCERVPNPWKPDFLAWEFPLNAETKSIATEYYESIGKPLPAVLRDDGGDAD